MLLTVLAVASCTNPLGSGSVEGGLEANAGGAGGDNPAPSTTVDAESARSALETAIEARGADYEWAADGPDAFDCSGLIVWAYQRSIGADAIFRGAGSWQDDITMDDLYRYGAEHVALDDLRPGDIPFITAEEDRITHGGLFMGWESESEIEFINASGYYDSVVVDRWPQDGKKREQWIAGGGRLRVPR